MMQYNKTRVYLIIFFAAMGGMLYGYDIGIINGAFLFIENDIPMSAFQTSLLGGSVLFGGAFAILVAGLIADAIGRKKTLILAGLIFIVSVGLIYVSDNYEMLLFSRLVQGVSVGFITVTVPLYLTETVPDSVRGVAVTCFQLFLTAGILISNYIGLLFESSGDWRSMFLTSLIPAIIFFAGSFFLLKSPRWLIMVGKDKEAEQMLEVTVGSENAKSQADKIKQVVKSSDDEGSLLASLKNRHYLMPVLIVFTIAILAQMTGINSILQFSSTLLKESGLGSNYAAILGGVTITAINFMATILAVFIADKIERKFTVVFGTLMVALTLIMTGFMVLILPTGMVKGCVLLAGFISFIFFFAIGPGAYVWVIMSELLPNNIRSKALGIALFLNSMASAILASVFLPITAAFGDSSVFFICGSCTLLYCFIVFKYVPKTSGRSLEDIEKEFMK
ncbi:sugar porter family MFS transporter [Francisella adeliensis]|uniref:MFS transporter n=1 Tax=Francisella adeliensis TaxID=2007306 RepID=A0A2Z4XXM9_9GAMM|nr:sugar porter family MFS transporter [Francisella adeliensis]AXA33496.1 MFS transporter [Francisella adeliensis]MBK2084806.1 sugar porter family MFS transporter [Francisella adeliensis]MBK2097251.1 sugar porter family MFS transporter [Francisella adeliensis]QIW11727.1 sugar porter family MFS transporter [Francisella adeliensis]QIW13601.1 sugar porter family MFS transporter [Francisella adeliensis]